MPELRTFQEATKRWAPVNWFDDRRFGQVEVERRH
jgi:hypothetical protein